jgi:hypothetical protein
MDTPPEAFKAVAHLADDPDPINRARTTGDALNAIPALQKWLRGIRQQAVRQANDEGMTYPEIGRELGISGPRANAIANNSQSGSGSGKPAGRPRKSTPAESDAP